MAFAGCFSLPAIGIGISFCAMFATQKEKRFQRAAVDMLIGAVLPVVLTVIFSIIFSRQCGAYIPPWPEVARSEGVSFAFALRYFFYSTLGLNGFFIYTPLALIGAIALVKRLNHFERMTEKRKKLDFYARGQRLLTWGVYWGAITGLLIFLFEALLSGIPRQFDMSQLQMVQYSIGGEKFHLPSLLRLYGTPELLFLLPLLHYFNLHIFRERPFAGFQFYYHEVVRIGAVIAWIGLASPAGGYIAPIIWALNRISVFVTNYYPIGTLLW